MQRCVVWPTDKFASVSVYKGQTGSGGEAGGAGGAGGGDLTPGPAGGKPKGGCGKEEEGTAASGEEAERREDEE